MYTIEQYNALNSAIALGATSVQYSDKQVTYRSISDMLRVKSLMEADLFPSMAKVNLQNRRKFVQFNRGTDDFNR